MPNRTVIVLLAICAVIAVFALSMSGTSQLDYKETAPAPAATEPAPAAPEPPPAK